MIPQELIDLIEGLEFLTIATCNLEGQPNCAPMFLVKTEKDCIYLVDYTMGTTYRNLKVNSKVSIAVSDIKTFQGFKINGYVELLDSGKKYDHIAEELEKKVLRLTAERVLDGIKRSIKYKNFEIGITEKFIVYKINFDQIVKIGPRGSIKEI